MTKRRYSNFYDKSFVTVKSDAFEKIMSTNTLTYFVVYVGIFTLFTCFAMYEIVKTIQNYIDSPISTIFTVKTQDSIRLPQIYLCPSGRVTDDGMRKYGPDIDKAEFCRSTYFGFHHDDFHGTLTHSDKDSTSNINKLDVSNFTAGDMQKTYKNANLPASTFFIYCQMRTAFSSQVLCKTIYTEVFDHTYGRCFILDLKDKEQTTPDQALILILNLRSSSFENVSRSLRPKFFGLRVALAEKIDPTNIETSSFLLPTGVYTKVAIYRQDDNFLNVDSGPNAQSCMDPETDADDDDDDDNNNQDDVSASDNKVKFLSANYSRQSCKLECKMKFSVQCQNCLLPFDRTFLTNDSLSKYEFCTPQQVVNMESGICTNSTHVPWSQTLQQQQFRQKRQEHQQVQQQAQQDLQHQQLPHQQQQHIERDEKAKTRQYVQEQKVQEQQQDQQEPQQRMQEQQQQQQGNQPEQTQLDQEHWIQDCEAKCKMPCRSKVYSVRVSSLPLNIDAFPKMPDNRTKLNDILYVQFAFPLIEKRYVEQSESMQIDDVISNVGGQIGLWLGFSMIALLHFFFALIAAGCFKCVSCCSSQQDTDDT